MALLSALWFLALLRLSVGSETSCPTLAGVPGSPGHNGLPGRDGRDGLFGPKGEKGEPGHYINKEAIRNLVEEILQEQRKVAFWATLSGPNSHYRNIGPFENRHTLVYGSALTNIGNAYDTQTGIFTAPVRGVYFFNVVLFNANPPNTGLDIVKNGERVVSITDNPPGEDSEDTASNSVTLLLEKGDQIYNVLLVNRKIYTDQAGRNSFSGHLLYAMPN